MNPAPSRSAFAPGWLPALNRPDICGRESCRQPALGQSLAAAPATIG